MKKIILLIFILCLIGIAGCGKEEGEDGIPLKYQRCECEHEVTLIQHTVVDSILLFDVEKSTFEQIQELLSVNTKVKYVMCDFTNRNASYVFKPSPGWQTLLDICNFPFNYEWKIPKEGLPISFEADVYEKCNFSGGFPEYFYGDIILTTLKIQTK